MSHERDAVHAWFGISYSNYLVLPRTLLQSMPDEWQNRFVTCLNQLHDAFNHVEQAECYNVEPATEREVSNLTTAELAQTGYTHQVDLCNCYSTESGGKVVHVPPTCPHETTYYDPTGNEVSPDHLVMVPTGRDPIPHYNRGRAFVRPNIP
ncbi:hypothetical protein ACFY05_32975 [Microtetraspora fusca]|uniref:HNH endonuclease n=1 Tax=Microtetraspora fusca TaxID=1997 RepID=A0ABW6VHQ0_MICFU